MKLFAWQPKGFGEYSFFVSAENEEKARAAVDKYIADHLDKDDEEYLSEYSIRGWGTDYYKLTAVDAEQVITNCND